MLSTLYFPDFFKLLEGLEKSESKGQALKATENLFKFFDENGDGKLSKAEAKVGFERLSKNVLSRPWKGDMEKVFDELKDDQGKVSIEGEMEYWYEMKWNAYNLKLITFLLDLMKHAEKDCPYPDSDKWGCQQSTSPIKQPCGYTILIIFVHSIDSFNWKPLQIIFQNKLRKINPNNRLKPEGAKGNALNNINFFQTKTEQLLRWLLRYKIHQIDLV